MNNYPSPKQIDMGCVPIVTRMMTNGVRLNLDHFSNMSKRYHERLIIIQEEMDSLCGHHLNASSPDQVLQWMELNKVQDREGKKPISADTETIAPIAIDYPVLRLIMEYRKLHKLLGTYVDKFPKLVDVNGRLHTNYSITSTDTYRLASHNCNLQNVSKRTKEGLDVRRGFIPRDGYTFVKRDYSAQELRWLANLSGDSTMLNTYRTGGDLHLETEKAIFGTSDGSNRNPSKSINFGTVYGISGDGLWHQFLIMGVGQYSKFDCQNMLDRWFMKYPGVYYFMEDCRARAMRDGYVTDYFGYKCYVPEVHSYHKDIAERGLRQACNFLIQCPSAAQTKLAMRSWLDVIDEIRGWEPLLQIHDEFISEVPDDGIEEADSILRYVMNDAVTGLSLKFDSEGGAGANWADMIKLKG